MSRTITVQLLGGDRRQVAMPVDKSVTSLVACIIKEFDLAHDSSLKLICGGSVVGDDQAHGKKWVGEIGQGEIVMAMQVRSKQAPLPAWGAMKKADMVSKEEDKDEDEDEDMEVQRTLNELPPHAGSWEKSLVALLRRAGTSPVIISAVILIRPLRIAWLSFFLVALLTLHRIDKHLGPPFILLAILCCIFLNLSSNKKPGELSAYSICNEGVKRLPGQLDADSVDEQIRRGQI